jgi:hypothetical protein
VSVVEEIVRDHWPAGKLTRRMENALKELRELADPDEKGDVMRL